jgi:tRNA1(Val) A37 N6-methylase TrmN6
MGRICIMAAPEITEDAILGGRLRVRQPARGYRVNVDTILLAAAVEAPPGARLLEAGCGVGAALLAVAARSGNARFVGLERDQNIAALARENVALNAMTAHVDIITGDVLERNANFGVFDGVFFNPPFDREGDGRPPAEARRAAHVADAPVDAWIAALADRLRGGAALTFIHRAAKLAEIMSALEGRLGGVEIMPVRPTAASPAKRLIVRARKGSRAPLRLLKGLDLHDASGAKHTLEAEAILRGDQTLDWGH